MTQNRTLNEDDQAEQEEKEKQRRLQELEDIKAILTRPEGVRFFRRLVKEGRVFTTTFTGNSWSYFYEGQRNLVNKLIADVAEAAPEKIVLLIMEEGHD